MLSIYIIILLLYRIQYHNDKENENKYWMEEVLENFSWRLSIRTLEIKNLFLMILNCFCGMADQPKAFSLISGQEYCQRSSTLRIYDNRRAGFELALNLSSGLVEWSSAVVITTTLRRHKIFCITILLHHILGYLKGLCNYYGLKQFLFIQSV